MRIRPARVIAVSALVVAALSAATAAFASPASAESPCWRQIQNEWVKTDHVSSTYPLHCYREAIAHVPNDLKQYSSIVEDILAARQQAARRGVVRTTQGHIDRSQAQNRRAAFCPNCGIDGGSAGNARASLIRGPSARCGRA